MEKAWIFRKASLDDASFIAKINAMHVGNKGPGGFLIIALDESEIRHLIESADIDFYAAKRSNGELLGYAEITSQFDRTLLNNMTWVNGIFEQSIKQILSGDFIYIKQLAIHPSYQRQGVATFLYKNLEAAIKKDIIVFAAHRPFHNEPSIAFHKKMGFTMVAKLHRSDFGGHSEYESFFFMKKLSN
ncbi:MAG: GNAT family N-acetyltransferase [Candidatus Lokiarchaeota archaeon]|nr:GNAT family N-acetyltransferase [Candidatus Lokiarchaeota archaeon]